MELGKNVQYFIHGLQNSYRCVTKLIEVSYGQYGKETLLIRVHCSQVEHRSVTQKRCRYPAVLQSQARISSGSFIKSYQVPLSFHSCNS